MAGYRMSPRRFALLSIKHPEHTLTKHAAFLAEYPILDDTLAADLSPAEKLVACQTILLEFDLQIKLQETNEYFERLKDKKPNTTKARYVVRVLNKDNDIIEDTKITIDENGIEHEEPYLMEFGAKSYSSAERLGDRKTMTRDDAAKYVIIDTTDKPIATIIERRDALARILAKPHQPLCRMPKRSADLHWAPKSHATRSITRWFISR
jgi:hypothetical protein